MDFVKIENVKETNKTELYVILRRNAQVENAMISIVVDKWFRI